MEFRSDHKVYYINHMGDDKEIVEDARTSILTKPGQKSPNRALTQKDIDRIYDFFEYRHASTLRGCVLKVGLETTIAMQRQLRTHWVGNKQYWPEWQWDESDILGFNDQSGKYTKYKPVFYIPSLEMSRVEVDGFDPMVPEYRKCTEEEYKGMIGVMKSSYEASYRSYEVLNTSGVSRELTRMCIPEGMYVAGRMTLNLNAAFGLMSLRIDSKDNAIVTKPQAEIQEIAEGIENIISGLWPVAYDAWVEGGRTRP
jgi:thymidylate synthase (FAD)